MKSKQLSSRNSNKQIWSWTSSVQIVGAVQCEFVARRQRDRNRIQIKNRKLITYLVTSPIKYHAYCCNLTIIADNLFAVQKDRLFSLFGHLQDGRSWPNMLPNSKLTSKLLLNWQNFAKSDHTVAFANLVTLWAFESGPTAAFPMRKFNSNDIWRERWSRKNYLFELWKVFCK